MFDRILGSFLVERKRITKKQLQEVMETQDTIRVKLGVIAVSEKLMTIEQTEKINLLQASLDKRFGDLAVETKYLTEEQVKRLLTLQGNEYLVFIQTLINKGFMSMSDIEEALTEYQEENGFMESEMNSLKSGDADRIVPIFLTMDHPLYKRLFGCGVRTIYRLVDNHMAISKSSHKSTIKAKAIGYQQLVGMNDIFVGIAGSAESIKKIAIAYTREEFIENEEDGLDAICELINCINGLFVTELSKERIEIDMEPPFYSVEPKTVHGKEIYTLPMTVCGEKIELLISILPINEKITVK